VTNQQLPFSMDPSTPQPPPEHRALVSCLVDLRRYFLGAGETSATLHRLFDRGSVGNGEPWPWELCRWHMRYIVVDDNDQHWLRDEDHPEVKPDDFLACCDPDPGCFGPDHFWHTYTEYEFKRILEHTFSVWAKEDPNRRSEYATALAEFGMKLVQV